MTIYSTRDQGLNSAVIYGEFPMSAFELFMQLTVIT